MLLLIAMVGCNATNNRVASPDGRLEATFNLDDSGTPYYTLSFDGVEVIKPSSLGLTTAECDYTTALSLAAIEHSSKDETWETVWGQFATIRDNYNALRAELTTAEG